jgi:regulator of RNase E activity RraA
VFSTGYTCQDVRKRATTDSINKRISIEGVSISPGDLIFGDSEYIIVIPKPIETEVVEEIFKRASNEKRILIDISMGADVNSLVKNYGFF